MENILDLTEDGGAIIEMQDFLLQNENKTITVEIPKFKHSALIFFKEPFTQLQEIEEDISMADTSEREQFLLKYKLLLEKYGNNNADFGKEYWNSYKKKNTVSAYFKPQGIRSIRISVSHYQLRHSLAWYLQNLLDKEICQLNDKLEIQKGIIKSANMPKKTIVCFRDSPTPKDAIKSLINTYDFSKKQAKYLANLSLHQFLSLDATEAEKQIKNHEEFVSFLVELKS